MSLLQKEFGTFHSNIKLGSYDEDESLRVKRNLLIDELTTALQEETIPNTDKKLTFKKFDQGSYAMKTGIKPIDDDYDIDVGVLFDITNEEYDSNKLKKLVYDKLNAQHNRTVKFNRPCITVEYSSGYHVDLAIYSNNDDNYHIAWGKEHSKTNRCWYKSEPKKLTKWVSDVSSNSEHSKQFRHCVRYLKQWKNKHFSSNGNVAPPSIGLTIQVRNAFSLTAGYRKDRDLDALINIVSQMKSDFIYGYDSDTDSYLYTIETPLPVEPYKDVYYKMSPLQLNKYYEKLDSLLEALESAREEESEHETSKILRKVFGDDFPLVEDVKRSDTKPYVPTGHNA